MSDDDIRVSRARMNALGVVLLLAMAATGVIAYRAGYRAAPNVVPAPAASEPEHDDEPAHAGLAKRVRLQPQVITAAGIRNEPVKKEVLRAQVELPGEIAAHPDRSARIAAPVAGRIEEVTFLDGANVKKGDPLVVIRVPELARIRAAHVSAMARAKAARAQATRLKELEGEGIASKKALAEAEAEATSLEAEASALGAELAAMGGATGAVKLTLRAPIDGTVLARNAVVGQPITADESVGSIADLKEVWFIARLFEHDLHQVAIGAPAEIELNAHPGVRFPGSLDVVGFQVDPAARTVTARIKLANADAKLRIGLFGVAHVATQETVDKPPTLVVPRSAVTQIGGKSVVFVRHPDDDFELHEVVLGTSGIGKVEVLAGLREGEQVVISGVFTLKSAVLKSTFAEEE